MFTAAIAAGCAWYVIDTYATSSRAKNVILILPIGVIGVVLASGLLFRKAVGFLRGSQTSPAAGCVQHRKPKLTPETLQTVAVTALFALYCISVDVVGFDAATFIFVLVSLFALGERSKVMLVVYPASFTLVALKMVALTSYDIPVFLEVMGR